MRALHLRLASLAKLRPPRGLVALLIWLTRISGAAIVLAGISFFVLAWAERSFAPIAMGLVTIVVGVYFTSIRATSDGGLEYGLLRKRRQGS